MSAQSLQLCPTLCDPMDYSPPGSSVHGFLQARILERVAISYSRDLLDPRVKPTSLESPASAGRLFTTGANIKPKNTGVDSLSLLQRIFPTQE